LGINLVFIKDWSMESENGCKFESGASSTPILLSNCEHFPRWMAGDWEERKETSVYMFIDKSVWKQGSKAPQ
jgi:hypothetical protein